jgi:putative Mn2+ efflux pump MntP
LWITALMTSRGWELNSAHSTSSRSLNILAIVYPAICFIQYTIGGFIRHLGTLLHEHVFGAILVFIFGVWVVVASFRSGNRTIKRRAVFVGLSMVLQVLIGVLVWRTKYGFPSLNMMAVQHSMMQIIARSIRTIVGMVVVTTAVLWSIQTIRIARMSKRSQPDDGLKNESELLST